MTAGANGCRLLHVFPTFAVGGVQRRILDVAARLGPRYSHRIISLDGRWDALAHAPEGIDIVAERDCAGMSGLACLPVLVRYLRGADIDILCTYNWGAMDWAFAARLARRPAHLHFESGFSVEEAQRRLQRRDLYRRVALADIAALVVPSRGLSEIAAAGGWARVNRIRIIPNGVDTAFFRCDRRNRNAPEAPVPIASIAPLRPEKGLDRLIALFAGVAPLERSSRLDIVGDGGERPRLEACAAESGVSDRIRLHGHLRDVRPALCAAEIFAMTSLTEQMPNALLQAMAAGLAVIAFDAGDVRRILPPEQRAFVYHQGDDDGFCAGLRRLIADADLRRLLGAANRRRAENDYPMEGMVEAYRRLYDEARPR